MFGTSPQIQPQPIQPQPPVPASLLPPKPGSKLRLIVIIFLSIGGLLLAALAVIYWNSAQHANKILQEASQKSFDKGRQEQKTQDDVQAEKLAEAPFRSYVAPAIYGGLEIKFPKNWSAYLLENESSGTQINLTLHPNFVSVVSGRVTYYAFHATLVREQYKTAIKRYDDLLKKGTITSKPTKVSGIAATRLEGKLDNKRDTVLVIVPVRDKVVNFFTDDLSYLDEFNQILSQSIIVP